VKIMTEYLKPNIVEWPFLRDRREVFEDRGDAGRALAGLLEPYRGSHALVLGIPAGGVPLGILIAQMLELDLDVAVVNKITLPWNTEVGYGGVAWDGTLWLNEDVLRQSRLSERQIQEGIETTREKVARRVRLLRNDQPPPAIEGRTVIMVDDGLATGSTVRVAVKAVRRAGAAHIVVAVPTGHEDSVIRLAREVSCVYCANIRSGWSFAVAGAYRAWTNLEEPEVASRLAAYRASMLAAQHA
jgi:putative phosphoribosyl transferase